MSKKSRNVAILTCKALGVEFRCGVVIQGVRVFMESWYVLHLRFMQCLDFVLVIYFIHLGMFGSYAWYVCDPFMIIC